MTSQEIPTKVLDKRVKDGWFGRSYYVTLKALTEAEDSRSPIVSIKASIHEWKFGLNTYHAVEVGQTYLITWYKTERGGWVPYNQGAE